MYILCICTCLLAPHFNLAFYRNLELFLLEHRIYLLYLSRWLRYGPPGSVTNNNVWHTIGSVANNKCWFRHKPTVPSRLVIQREGALASTTFGSAVTNNSFWLRQEQQPSVLSRTTATDSVTNNNKWFSHEQGQLDPSRPTAIVGSATNQHTSSE